MNSALPPGSVWGEPPAETAAGRGEQKALPAAPQHPDSEYQTAALGSLAAAGFHMLRITYLCFNAEERQTKRRGEKEKGLDKPGTSENAGEAESIQGGKYCELQES